MSLCRYAEAWRMQSNGTADAGGSVVQDVRSAHAHLTYRQLSWQTCVVPRGSVTVLVIGIRRDGTGGTRTASPVAG